MISLFQRIKAASLPTTTRKSNNNKRYGNLDEDNSILDNDPSTSVKYYEDDDDNSSWVVRPSPTSPVSTSTNNTNTTTTVPPGVTPQHLKKLSRRGIILSVLFILVTFAAIVTVIFVKLYDANKNDERQSSSNQNSFVLGGINNNNNGSSSYTPTGSSENDNKTNDTNNDNNSNKTIRCNGYEHLCNVPANFVYYATVHNAASTTQDGVLVLANHAKNLESALAAGYRGINLDIGKCDGSTINQTSSSSSKNSSLSDLRFVHGTCLIANRDPIEVLNSITSFLHTNPYEVLLMPLQIEQNAEGGTVHLPEIADLFATVPKFQQQLYTHPSPNQPWPTLHELINNNTRIILMHYDAQERCSELDGGVCPTGFNEWFEYAAETQYDFEYESNFLNLSYACPLTRGYIQPRNASDFIGMNFFLRIPNPDICPIMNQKDYIVNHMNKCSSNYHYKLPNVLLFDCWDIGGVLDVVKELNEQLNPNYINNTTENKETAELVLSFPNVTTTINNSEAFESICTDYFNTTLYTNYSNLDCSLISQSTEKVTVKDFRNRRRHYERTLQNEIPVLEVLIQLSGIAESKEENDTVSSSSSSLNQSSVPRLSTTALAVIDDTGRDFASLLRRDKNTSSTFKSAYSVTATELVHHSNNDTQASTAKTVAPTNKPSKAPSTLSPTVAQKDSTGTPVVVKTTTSPTKAPHGGNRLRSCTLNDQDMIRFEKGVSFRFYTDETAKTITGELVYDGLAWLGLSFSESSSMIPAIAVIGLPDNDNVGRYSLLSRSVEGVTQQDVPQTLSHTKIQQNGTHTIMRFTKLLEEADDVSPIPLTGEVKMNYAVGCSNVMDRAHCFRGSVSSSNDAPCSHNVTQEDISNSDPGTDAPEVTSTETPATAPPVPTEAGAAPPAPSSTTAIDGSGDLVCNGHANLCDLPVNKILFATVHNAAASVQDGFVLLPNQQFSLERALDSGFRGINVDLGICNGAVELVHGYCFVGTRDPTTVYTDILSFLKTNPNEVLILPTQINNDLQGEVTNDAIDAIFQSIDGFKDIMYSHPGPDTAWPTLREMIQNNKRIIYMQYNSNYPCANGGCPSGFHDWFEYAAENQFQYDNTDQLQDAAYACQLTRGDDRTSPDFLGFNIFTTIPSQDIAATINTKSFVETFVQTCSAANNNLQPNLVLVDFWNVGDVLEVVKDFNAALK